MDTSCVFLIVEDQFFFKATNVTFSKRVVTRMSSSSLVQSFWVKFKVVHPARSDYELNMLGMKLAAVNSQQHIVFRFLFRQVIGFWHMS